MRCVLLLAGCCLPLGLIPAVSAADPGDRAGADFFEKAIRPVLVEQCQQCHGADKQKGGLRLDSRAALLAGGDSGPAVVPGKPDESLLLKAVHYKDSPKMPPKAPLSRAQVEALGAWVKQGVPWPETKAVVRPAPAPAGLKVTDKDREFWSFRPVADPPIPGVYRGWSRTSVDPFVLARLEAVGLRPAPEADRRTLIRRVSFDLVGLPPTPEEVEAFVKDDRPDAYEQLVERLLASPHHGERWARHWLDVARYGEDQAHTFQARKYPDGYRYRDWVARAFNTDLPYDRFLLEQIAADLLDDPGQLERLPALGFFALGPVYYGDSKKLDQLDDRVDTLTRGVLGLTVACARCHDHKFDPIPTRDYYSLAGVFHSTEYQEVPLGPAPPPPPPPEKGDKKKNQPPKGPVIHALKEGTSPADMRVHVRGNPATLGEEAPRRFLSVLSPEAPLFKQGSGRLELARAIASADNPLTARVFVNRVWMHHFGKGLVRTPSNFGALGERPTHPDLLDHLATKFVRSGWSVKELHRAIVLSAAYRQQSRVEGRGQEVDPDNKLLWRMNRRRLEVEAWRDSVLAVSGQLDRTLGGPSKELADPANRRRTFYAAISRHELNPLLRLFDYPDPNLTCDERPVTTVPLQQLFVLNGEFMVQSARTLSALLAASGADASGRIEQAFLLLYGRSPTAQERKLALDFVADNAAKDDRLSRWEQLAQVLLAANESMFVD